MKSIRRIALSVLLTVGAFTAVMYTSCSKDECKDVTCQNGGTCSGGTCTCPTGYEGTNCQTLTRDKFVGSYTGTDQCTTGQYNINLSISAASANNLQVLINNVGGFGTSITATGVVTSTNQVTITSANVGSGRVLNGTMTFNNNVMTFQYTVVQGTDTDNCNGTYTKQ